MVLHEGFPSLKLSVFTKFHLISSRKWTKSFASHQYCRYLLPTKIPYLVKTLGWLEIFLEIESLTSTSVLNCNGYDICGRTYHYENECCSARETEDFESHPIWLTVYLSYWFAFLKILRCSISLTAISDPRHLYFCTMLRLSLC